MPTRRAYIEQVRRMIYGAQPTNDASITVGLVNQWLNQAIGVAAKTNYTDSIKLDGIAYINNSFYTTFKSLTISQDEQFLYKVELPQIPVGIGQDEGISTLKIKDTDSRQISQSVIWLTQNQRGYIENMRPIPNKLLAYSEGKYVYIISTLLLSSYTAHATMVSGGLSTDLESTLNVPDDYLPVVTEYLKQQLMFSRQVPVDATNDGLDAVTTT